jgi:hypothetical protein
MSDLLPVLCAVALVGLVGPARAAATASTTSAWQRLNNLIGIALFSDTNLWDDTDAVTAKRLGLPQESRTSQQASFRVYPDATARLLGARPYSVALYGASGTVAYLSIVFANKGDIEGLSVGGDRTSTRADTRTRAAALKTYQSKIRADAKTIEQALSGMLGKPTTLWFGEGSRDTTERSMRWNAGMHSILLSSPKDEYVAVRIVPRTLADNMGRAERIDDSSLRTMLAGRVQHRDNGDVVITDIPMVDQGPKGYCVPATWERYLRFIGIPADMYVLAMAGETGAGGGTYLNAMEDNVKQLVTRHGRRIVVIHKVPKIRFISDSIDKGIPLMWTLGVPRAFYVGQLLKRARERRSVTDWPAWKKTLQARRVSADSLRDRISAAHICMVIGYNKTTGEIAFSDSWGRGYEERWMTEVEAETIGGPYLTAITW